MGKAMDVYKAFFDAAWSNPPSSFAEADATYLADDFHSFDSHGNPVMDKAGYTAMSQLLASAFTGFKFVISEYQEDGDSITLRGHFEGTHTGPLDLSAMGLGVLPPSGRMIVWPEAREVFTIRNGKIAGARDLGEGGMPEFLAALGVELPSP